ncbi:hypothetical protein SKAU_G00413440 [Synaphobranchus kaupii]|uniref:Uncharacterized protein n=1 Tax=Synaphobranchus kaupii TaxID=118154 RepID=A0A9Q1E885_SYNKA|nr:hypothetical protein SKAU_G00413440 [Synaphobranchus kaupii]
MPLLQMTGLLGPALAVMNLPSLSLVVKLAAERRRRTTTIFQDRSSPLSPATTTQVQLIKAFEAEPHVLQAQPWTHRFDDSFNEFCLAMSPVDTHVNLVHELAVLALETL